MMRAPARTKVSACPLKVTAAVIFAADLCMIAADTLVVPLLAAPPSENNSCCKLSACNGAVEVTPTSDGWTDGCQKDAKGNCLASSHCYTCTGSSSPTDLCYYSGRPDQHCTATGISGWRYYDCGRKIQQECRNGGGSVSGCCAVGVNPIRTGLSCKEPECLPFVSSPCQ